MSFSGLRLYISLPTNISLPTLFHTQPLLIASLLTVPPQVSDTQFVFAKCPGCNCADELGNCLAGCEATNCGCDGCRGAEAACGTEGGCGTCGNIQGHCDMSYMQGCANKPKIQPGRFLRAGGGSGGAAGTSGGRKNSNRTRISPSPAPKMYVSPVFWGMMTFPFTHTTTSPQIPNSRELFPGRGNWVRHSSQAIQWV